ncbi:MAG: type II toxin-antitoxin system VapC family toxin [Lysobacterales bacterium]
MIGLDTNVLVRYIVQDDSRQSPKSNALLESLTLEAPGFVALVSVVELYWVLSDCYSLSREQVAKAIEGLLQTREIVVDRAERVAHALRIFRSGGGDFADCLIALEGFAAGCERILTFDRRAAKVVGMTLIG